MKKWKIIFILIDIALILTSCNVGNVETTEKIAAPHNTTPPVLGQWKIDKYKIVDGTKISEHDIKKIMTKKVLFYNDLVIVGDDYCLEPNYKIKKVDTLDYLLYHYKIKPEFLGIKDEQVQVINISKGNQFFYEIIKKDSNNIIVNIDGVFLFLSKISNDVDTKLIKKYYDKSKNVKKLDSKGMEDILRTGLLLGLRYYDEKAIKNNEQPWKYRTIWIHSYNKDIKSVYETDDIFLPRKTGFWKVRVDSEVIDNNVNDIIVAYPFDKRNIKKAIKKYDGKGNKNIFSTKLIQYIGNDYISIEDIESKPNERKMFQTYLIDSIDVGRSVKISDICGEGDEEDFGLGRRNGHWIMKGRLNYGEDEKQISGDFNIKAIPPVELVHYDELSIPWNAIKMRIPEVIDVFTSPNEDIAIIVTYKNILIYPINNGEIGEKPFEKIALNNREEVIMGEWAIGKYPSIWENEFLKNDIKELKPPKKSKNK